MYAVERRGAEWKIFNKEAAGSQGLNSKPLGNRVFLSTVVEATNSKPLGKKCPRVDTVDQIL